MPSPPLPPTLYQDPEISIPEVCRSLPCARAAPAISVAVSTNTNRCRFFIALILSYHFAAQGVGFQPEASACFLNCVLNMNG